MKIILLNIINCIKEKLFLQNNKLTLPLIFLVRRVLCSINTKEYPDKIEFHILNQNFL